MKKVMEIATRDSCWNRAQEDEVMFVLLARDASAPVAIREWVNDRVTTGKNKISDPKIIEALRCATAMEEQRKVRDFKLTPVEDYDTPTKALKELLDFARRRLPTGNLPPQAARAMRLLAQMGDQEYADIYTAHREHIEAACERVLG